jgi:hypothetical protein
MNPGSTLTAIGLAAWLGVIVAAAIYIPRRMRFPPSMFAPEKAVPLASQVIGGLVGVGLFGYYAFTNPGVALAGDLVVSATVLYVLIVYAVALMVERRRAKQVGLPEPGTSGTSSSAECVVLLAFAVLLALAATLLTIYGIDNQLGGNGGEGVAGLILGAMAWVIAIVLGLFGLLALRVVRYRRLSR